MHMGNLLRQRDVVRHVMATTESDHRPLGVDHPTVVPTNFEPQRGAESTDAESE